MKKLHRALREFAEEVGVCCACKGTPQATRRHRKTLVVVEKDNVYVAGIIHLPPTKLSHCQHDRPGPNAAACARAGLRCAQSLHQPHLFACHHNAKNRLCDGGERRTCCGRSLSVEEIVHSDAQLLRRFESRYDRANIGCPVAEFCEICSECWRTWQPRHQQAIEQFVDHPRITREQACQKWTRRADLYSQIKRGRVKAEQLPEHPLAAE